jgi:hypothetical protein
LVHEAWFLSAGPPPAPQRWDGGRRFFAAAAEVMRHISAEKRPLGAKPEPGRGGSERVDPDRVELFSPLPAEDLLALPEGWTNCQNWTPRPQTSLSSAFLSG